MYLHDWRYLRTCVFECVCVGGCARACHIVCVCVYVHRRARARFVVRGCCCCCCCCVCVCVCVCICACYMCVRVIFNIYLCE